MLQLRTNLVKDNNGDLVQIHTILERDETITYVSN
jgi:hypothetical protein